RDHRVRHRDRHRDRAEAGRDPRRRPRRVRFQRRRAAHAPRSGVPAAGGGSTMTPTRRPTPAICRSLATFNYRGWVLGALVSTVRGRRQAAAHDWVVLTALPDNDATAMGVTMALQFGPPLVLVSITGWVADRFDRRKILLLTQSVLMMLALGVAALLLT